MATVLVGIYSPFEAWNIPERHIERLRRDFPGHTFLHATTDDDARELIVDADVAFMSEVRAPQFAAARRLRWVHSPAAGIGGMLFPEMVASPVAISNSRGTSAGTIAEHVVAVTLALFRKLPQAFRRQAAREWAQDEMLGPPQLRMLAGSDVLIVGLGSIGTATAERCAALGARVTGIRRHVDRPAPKGVSAVLPPEALLARLPLADVVVIAAAQTALTRRMFGAEQFAAMRRDAVLVNVSRGKLVDERALAGALQQGIIGAAALDVFEHEPLAPESPLWDLPNVLVTPHMSGFRADHWDVVTDLFAANLRRFLAGEPLANIVDKQAGY